MHQTFQITAQKGWKKECPTFLHKIVDRSPNLASCFDTEGKGTQFLWETCGEKTWDQSPLFTALCSLSQGYLPPLQFCIQIGLPLGSDCIDILQVHEDEAATAFLEDS